MVTRSKLGQVHKKREVTYIRKKNMYHLSYSWCLAYSLELTRFYAGSIIIVTLNSCYVPWTEAVHIHWARWSNRWESTFQSEHHNSWKNNRQSDNLHIIGIIHVDKQPATKTSEYKQLLQSINRVTYYGLIYFPPSGVTAAGALHSLLHPLFIHL